MNKLNQLQEASLQWQGGGNLQGSRKLQPALQVAATAMLLQLQNCTAAHAVLAVLPAQVEPQCTATRSKAL